MEIDLAKGQPRSADGSLGAQLLSGMLLRLIRRYLRTGIMVDGLVFVYEEGTPQDPPLSPILSQIVLDELDKYFERRGLKLCKYADDCNIYVKS